MESGNVAIAVPGDPDLARAVLTRGRRIAGYLGIEWVAVRVLSDGESVGDLRDLVSAYGGLLLCANGRSVAHALLEVASRENARVLVLGRSRRGRLWRRLLRGTTETILRAKPPFDVVIAAEGTD